MPFWNVTIAPKLMESKKVLFSAHGNTVRALAKYLTNISNKDIIEVDVPAGIPLVYEFDTERSHLFQASGVCL
jgi:2,3-bisphosphoglycerate-dependent phosphoglycerate mutase